VNIHIHIMRTDVFTQKIRFWLPLNQNYRLSLKLQTGRH
jgi:hypothetical protein